MLPADATRLVAYLNAAYPAATLEEESAVVLAQEIALLHDGVTAKAAIEMLVRSAPRFPSIAEIRAAYRGEAARRRPAPELPPAEDCIPREDVARLMRETTRRLQMPDAPERVVEDAGFGECADCGEERNLWTLGESGRLLCGECCQSRLRAAAKSSL